ncbi:MAG: oxygen-independent coproporphyrinogen III oxidase [Alphaproteobacteria bacterium]|nr:oxygen-independent coproporphyrinogen III oxidase [Alphaproteobacteria bacterium]
MTDPVLLKYAARNTPRYTSYPTAPHFHAGVDGATYAGWLGELTPDHRGSLYFHLPYCRVLCWYCGCHTRASLKDGPIDRYLDRLEMEIDTTAALIPHRQKVDHLHWGGGSPTLVPADRMRRIMALVRDRFDLQPGAEIAIEVDPRTLDDARAAALGDTGFNRASIGVQTFDPDVRRAINRIQSFEVTKACADRLRGNGVSAINVDLVYGLPKQSLESCIETVDRVLELEPDRLSVFGYAHVPHMKGHMRLIETGDLPGTEARIAQAQAIAERLVAAGYAAIGFDHYARPGDPLAERQRTGHLHRNFQGYTTDAADALIGFGASAIGRLPQGHVQNTADIAAWEKTVAAGDLPVARGCAYEGDDLFRSEIIERLMCDLEADLGTLARKHGQPVPNPDLSELEADGIVRRDGDLVVINPVYRTLARIVAAAFDKRLMAGNAKHSVSV